MDPRPLRVLVVEDNADTAQAMTALLRSYGHDVRAAGDGRSALDAPGGPFPDVVLMDIGLPDIDGYEVAKAIRAARHEKRPLVIAVTGLGREIDRGYRANDGIDMHLRKPLDVERLQALLRRFDAIIS